MTATRLSKTTVALAVVATLTLAAVDLITKEWAQDALASTRSNSSPPLCEASQDGFIEMQKLRKAPLVLIDDYLEFRYAENCGAAFGLMRDAPSYLRKVVFGTAALAASILMFTMFLRSGGRRAYVVAIPLVIGGALGNLTDRVRHGYVIDFIRFHLNNSWEYPTFNVADIWITVGVVILIVDGFLEGRREASTRGEAAQGPVSTRM